MIMAFESLRDPGNLGTVIRSASAFGVDTLLLSADCADIYIYQGGFCGFGVCSVWC